MTLFRIICLIKLSFVLVASQSPHLVAMMQAKAYLIKSKNGMAVFVKGWQLAEQSYTDAFPASSKCACRKACSSLMNCIAYSYNSTGICAFTDRLGAVTQDDGATYEYQRKFEPLSDGKHYTNSSGVKTHSECLAECAQPGMGLPILTTVASKVALQDFTPWLALTRSDSFLWYDGSELNYVALKLKSTEPYTFNGQGKTNAYIIHDELLKEARESWACKCQGYFENVQ